MAYEHPKMVILKYLQVILRYRKHNSRNLNMKESAESQKVGIHYALINSDSTLESQLSVFFHRLHN